MMMMTIDDDVGVKHTSRLINPWKVGLLFVEW